MKHMKANKTTKNKGLAYLNMFVNIERSIPNGQSDVVYKFTQVVGIELLRSARKGFVFFIAEYRAGISLVHERQTNQHRTNNTYKSFGISADGNIGHLFVFLFFESFLRPLLAGG